MQRSDVTELLIYIFKGGEGKTTFIQITKCRDQEKNYIH